MIMKMFLICLFCKLIRLLCLYRNARMFVRQDTEENVLLRATEATEKLIKVISFP